MNRSLEKSISKRLWRASPLWSMKESKNACMLSMFNVFGKTILQVEVAQIASIVRKM